MWFTPFTEQCVIEIFKISYLYKEKKSSQRLERLTFFTSCTKAFVIDIEKWLNIYFLLLPAYVVISLDRTRKRYIFRIWNSLIYNLDTFVHFIYMEVSVTKLVVSRANELTKNLIHSTFISTMLI